MNQHNYSENNQAGTGMEYLARPTHMQKYRHLRRMLEKCWDIDSAHPSNRFDIDARFKYSVEDIRKHLYTYSNHALKLAHAEAVREYKGRGRPSGSRNRAHVLGETQQSSALEEIFGSDKTPEQSDDNNNANSQPEPKAQPEATQQGEMLNSSKFVLQTQHNSDIEYVLEKIERDDRVLSDKLNIFRQDYNTLHEYYKALNDEIKNQRPTIVEVKQLDKPALNLGMQHKVFPALLELCMSAINSASEPLNVWLYGPAGTGKTTAAKKIAEALEKYYLRDFPFYALSKLSTEYQVLGYQDASGRYIPTLFRKCYEHGGVIILDEIDSWSPNAMTALNGALANGYCAFPDGMIERHPDCIVIAGANTTGTGGTIEYVGRMKQDAASLDRFEMLHWPIDEALEAALTNHPEWLARVRHVRKQIAARGIKDVMITPRAAIKGAARIRAGISFEMAEELFLKRGMTDAQWNMCK